MIKILTLSLFLCCLGIANAKEINLECTYSTKTVYLSLNTDSSTVSKINNIGAETARLYSSADSYWFTDSIDFRHTINRTNLSYTKKGVGGSIWADADISFEGLCYIVESKSII